MRHLTSQHNAPFLRKMKKGMSVFALKPNVKVIGGLDQTNITHTLFTKMMN